jgi:hypothetical protein
VSRGIGGESPCTLSKKELLFPSDLVARGIGTYYNNRLVKNLF